MVYVSSTHGMPAEISDMETEAVLIKVYNHTGNSAEEKSLRAHRMADRIAAFLNGKEGKNG